LTRDFEHKKLFSRFFRDHIFSDKPLLFDPSPGAREENAGGKYVRGTEIGKER
jgi:hypothetical protein